MCGGGGGYFITELYLTLLLVGAYVHRYNITKKLCNDCRPLVTLNYSLITIISSRFTGTQNKDKSLNWKQHDFGC